MCRSERGARVSSSGLWLTRQSAASLAPKLKLSAKVPREDMSILIRALSKTLSTDLSIFITDLFFRLFFHYRGGAAVGRASGRADCLQCDLGSD